MIIPPIRDDIAVKRYGERLVIEDAARRVRVPIDQLTLLAMQELADGPIEIDKLCTTLEASRVELHRRIGFLNRHLVLETPRAIDQLLLHRASHDNDALWDKAELASAPLNFPGELVHGCVACGACCHGTDVGPLTDADIARVRSVDWSPHLPVEVGPKDWLVETVDHREKPITLMGTRQGRCVFHDDDALCTIHKVAGATVKPTICQQFPYTFTRTPQGIDVSFSMECRSWLAAKRNGRSVAEDEAEIRRLIAGYGPVVDLPLPVEVWEGLDISLERWLGLRDQAIDKVRAASDVAEIVTGLVTTMLGAWRDEISPYRDGEVFAERESWGLPDKASGTNDAIERFFGSCNTVRERFDEGFTMIAAEERKQGKLWDADRSDRLRWALHALLSGRRAERLVRFEHEVEIWRDMVLASLYAHEPARRQPLLYGTALLVLRLVAGHLLAGLSAQTALRARTTEQDVVDSMVLLTKMLRGSAYSALLRQSRRELVELFVHNAAVFSYQAAPDVIDPRFDE